MLLTYCYWRHRFACATITVCVAVYARHPLCAKEQWYVACINDQRPLLRNYAHAHTERKLGTHLHKKCEYFSTSCSDAGER